MTDWIEHDGSEAPKHAKQGDLVAVRFRYGIEQGELFPMTVEWWGPAEDESSNWRWRADAEYPENEIVAYRVVAK